ncbi:MAG: LamG domain-containing protein [Candidatus Omnitrophota bacterium]
MKKVWRKKIVGLLAFFLLGMLSGAAVMAQTYAESVLADHPISYWPFNNDLADAQGAVNLSPAASPTFIDGPGSGNKAYSSSSGKAWAAAFGTVDLNGLEDFSYEMWINLKGDNEGKYILQRIGLTNAGETGGGENSLIYQNGQVTFVGRSGELREPAAFALPNKTDQWRHLVLAYKYMDAILVFYLDGKEAFRSESALLEPIFGGNSDELYIGATRVNPEGRVFDGGIDEVAIYGKTLTADQVAAHYNAAFPGAYASAVKADQPISYWRFEDDFKDAAGPYDLIPSGVQFVAGPQGGNNKALFGRIVSLQAQALYNMDAFTYELWFNPINLSAQSYILFRNPGSAQHAVIYAYKPNKLEFFFLRNSERPAVDIPNQTDKWYYCVVVNDPSKPEFRIYIDGQLAAKTANYAVAGTGNMVVIGGSDQGDNFNGYIDEVAIYDYVLPDERIAAHFNSPIVPAGANDWSLY